MSAGFPDITIDGAPVDAKGFIEKGTGLARAGAVFMTLVFGVFWILATSGIGLLVIVIYPLLARVMRKRALALIHGSGVLVAEDQFPEIHACAETFRKRLGLQKEVALYLVEDNVANAMAVRFGKKNVILLTDDLIHGCLASGHPQSLSFVIAHELGHIALNHNGVLRAWARKHLRKLGRLDEYSADSVANALVGDKVIAYKGLLLLTVGYAMLPYLNHDAIIRQAQEVANNKLSQKAEKTLTHPLLLNRLHRVLRA